MARGSSVGNAAGYFHQLAQRGLSQRAALREFRAAGGRISNTAGRQLYDDVRETMARRPTVAGLPISAVPPADAFSPWRAGQPGRYAYQATVYATDQGSGASLAINWTVFSDEPITPEDALQQATDEAEAGATADTGGAGQTVRGAQLTGLYRTV